MPDIDQRMNIINRNPLQNLWGKNIVILISQMGIMSHRENIWNERRNNSSFFDSYVSMYLHGPT